MIRSMLLFVAILAGTVVAAALAFIVGATISPTYISQGAKMAAIKCAGYALVLDFVAVFILTVLNIGADDHG